MPPSVRVLSRSVVVAAAPQRVWELVNAASIEQTLERVKAHAERQD